MDDKKITITSSVCRKLFLEHYGGRKFESVEYFQGYSEEVQASTPAKQIKEKSDALFRLATQDVGERIREMKNTIQEQNSK